MREVATVDDEVNGSELTVDGVSAMSVGDDEDACGKWRIHDDRCFVELIKSMIVERKRRGETEQQTGSMVI